MVGKDAYHMNSLEGYDLLVLVLQFIHISHHVLCLTLHIYTTSEWLWWFSDLTTNLNIGTSDKKVLILFIFDPLLGAKGIHKYHRLNIGLWEGGI